jgi:hypothetical protein
MPVANQTDTNALLEAAKCAPCIPKGMEMAVVITLLQEIAGNTMTPNELMNAATCIHCTIPKGMQLEVAIYLLDNLFNSQ